MMMSDSKTNRPIDDRERQELLNSLIRERFGDWATNKVVTESQSEESE